MSILTQKTVESSGFKKKIDAASEELILENLQRYQYQYPVKSIIREITCNAIDSVAERKVALDILVNNKPVTDYFVEKEGAIFQDSKFDPTYYDPKWLSTESRVFIRYKVGTNQQKDVVEFEDFGVGLGGKRLKGYFSLGFSTKRLSKLPLGKFGIGAKSALAGDSPYYTMESRYNGQLFRFNIYSSTVDSLIPRFNLQTGQENKHINFGTEEEPYLVYYEDTTEFNGVKVTLEVKKHKKTQYEDAVQTQLLYFDNIQFETHENDRVTVHDYRAPILFENEDLVLSDNKIWSRPHLLLNRVNYGYIDWEELELEPKYGNIGIKVQPEDIEINPSRESVIWSDITKEMVLKRFQSVVKVATDFVQKELVDTDIIQWVYKAAQLSAASFSGSSILGRLANIVDLKEVKPTFSLCSGVRLSSKYRLLYPLNLREFTLTEKKQKGLNTIIVRREEILGNRWAAEGKPVVLMSTSASPKKDKYLLEHRFKNGFIGIRIPEIPADILANNREWTYDELREAGLVKDENASSLNLMSEYIAPMVRLLRESEHVLVYEDIEVPEWYKRADVDEEEIATEEEKELVQQSQEERRKVTGTKVFRTLVSVPSSAYSSQLRVEALQKDYSNQEIDAWADSYNEVYYATTADRLLLEIAALATNSREKLLDKGVVLNTNSQKYFFVLSSIENTRYLREFSRIQNFFTVLKNKKLSMSNALIDWNTTRLIAKELPRLLFLRNFPMSPEHCKKFRKLLDYAKAHYSVLHNIDENKNLEKATLYAPAINDLIQHLNLVHKFQELVKTETDPALITQAAKTWFGNPEISDAQAVNPEMYALLQELLEYAEPLQLLNGIEELVTYPLSYFRDADWKAQYLRSHEVGDDIIVPVRLDLETLYYQYLEFRGR